MVTTVDKVSYYNLGDIAKYLGAKGTLAGDRKSYTLAGKGTKLEFNLEGDGRKLLLDLGEARELVEHRPVVALAAMVEAGVVTRLAHGPAALLLVAGAAHDPGTGELGELAGDLAEEQVLRIARSLAGRSDHPVSKAVAAGLSVEPLDVAGFGAEGPGSRFLAEIAGLDMPRRLSDVKIGPEQFDELLAGANDMDRHFREAPLERNLPVLLAGGGFKHGQHLNFNAPYLDTLAAGDGGGATKVIPAMGREQQPLCNLYLSMLQRAGVKTDRFGSSTGTLTGLA